MLWSGPTRDLPEALRRSADTVSWGTSSDGIITPGLVDQHHHGCFGMDFGSSHERAIRDTLPALYATGTTSMVASLVSADLSHLVERIEILAPLVREGQLAGIHLEGPFLAEGRCGAHDPALLRHPDEVDPAALLAAWDGVLRSITYAPELRGAAKLARAALEQVCPMPARSRHCAPVRPQTCWCLRTGATETWNGCRYCGAVNTRKSQAMGPGHHLASAGC
ncbi:amidohydrolase family protein [Nesterenkonia haasae]|uniref:amidohydrolase family protein n=1 Tax=Nesterenkonia haasae TaxID=2587813 RepID=UPI001391E1E6|nr:amidohydrolase family protein [Nesterenkonia haasae]